MKFRKFRKVRKSLLSVLLVLTMLAGMLPFTLIPANAETIVENRFKAAAIAASEKRSCSAGNSADFVANMLYEDSTSYEGGWTWANNGNLTTSNPTDTTLESELVSAGAKRVGDYQEYDIIIANSGSVGFIVGGKVYYSNGGGSVNNTPLYYFISSSSWTRGTRVILRYIHTYEQSLSDTKENLGDDFYAYINYYGDKSERGEEGYCKTLTSPEASSFDNVTIQAPDYGNPNQIWHFRRQSGNYYSIQNMGHNDCYLNAINNGTGEGTVVCSRGKPDGNHYYWAFVKLANGYNTYDTCVYQMKTKTCMEGGTNSAMGINSGKKARLYASANKFSANLQFSILKINDIESGTMASIQSSRNANTAVATKDDGSTTDNNVQFADYTPEDLGYSNQVWVFEKSNASKTYQPIYNIKHKKSGKYLQVDDSSNLAYTNNIVVGDKSTGKEQQWLLLGDDLNHISFVPYCSIDPNKRTFTRYHEAGDLDESKYSQIVLSMDCTENTAGSGKDIRCYASNRGDGQKFIISPTRLKVDKGDFYSTIKSVISVSSTEGGALDIDYALSFSIDGKKSDSTSYDDGISGVALRRVSDKPAADQQWYFQSLGNGIYAIKNIANGYYLYQDTDNNARAGASFSNEEKYKWYVVEESGNCYSISNVSSYDNNLNIWLANVQNEQNVIISAADSTPASCWYLDTENKTAPAYGEDLGDTFWAYISPTTVENTYLHCSDAAGLDHPVSFITTTNETEKRQQENYWKFVRNRDGSYSIASCNLENTVLNRSGDFEKDTATERDVYPDGELTADNANYRDYIYDHRWFIRKYANGYRIESKMNGQVLKLDGTRLKTTKINSSDNSQLFNITKTDLSIQSDLPNVKMRLFNYGRAINEADDKVLWFFNGSQNVADKGQQYVDTYNGTPMEIGDYKPTMKATLGTDGYPEVTGNTDPRLSNTGSLKYLFDDSKDFVQGHGSAESYNLPTTDYANIANYNNYQSQCFKVNNPTSLFKKNTKNGLYYYDSLLNSAYFQRDTDSSGKKLSTGNFKLYDYTMTLPLADQGDYFEYRVDPSTITGLSNFTGNFYPFNIAHEESNISYGAQNGRMKVTSDATKAASDSSYIQNTANDYVNEGDYVPVNYSIDTNTVMDCWFGMTLECEFEQTSDGTFDDKPVQFNFKGDDDVWVYLDGVLILDIGGTHGAQTGSINFQTGDVVDPEHPVDENGKATTNLKALYQAVADKGGYKFNETTTIDNTYIQDNFTGNTFKANTKHVLNFYYMERGGAVSSCCLNFNLPKGTPSVTKEVTNSNSSLSDNTKYQFKIEKQNDDGSYTPFGSDVTYTIQNVDGSGSSEGKLDIKDESGKDTGYFYLKAGQTAYFHNIDSGIKYRVTEVGASTVSTNTTATYTTNVSGVSQEGSAEKKFVGNDYVVGPIKLQTNVTQDIKFKNTLNTASITIDKDVVNAKNNAIDSMPDSVYNFGLRVYKNNDGKTTEYGTIKFSIKGTELSTEKTINNLPAGASYDLWEYYPTDTSNRYNAPTFTDGDTTVTGRLVESSSSPSKNDVISGTINGNTVTVKNKLIEDQKITLTLKYYDRKVVSGEVANIDEQETAFSKQVELNGKNATFSGNKITSIKLENIITDAGVSLEASKALNNVVDDYTIFASQSTAQNAMTNEPRTYTWGKDDIDSEGNPFASHTIDADDAVYHTNSKRQPIKDLSKQEKWVTYYNQSGTAVDAEATNFIDFDKITNVTVWLYNTPHKYTVTTHVPSGNGNDKNSKIIYFDAYYNQLIGSYDGAGTSGDEYDFYRKEYEYYCDKYSIPLNEYDARGYTNDNGTKSAKTYTYSGALGQVGEENFSFWTDGEDVNSSEVISTDRYYNYRVTRDMHLYAQYGEKKQGVYTTSNGIDTYYTNDGTKKLRLNTVMNPYGFPDGKEHGNDKIDYTFVAYLDIKDNSLRAHEFTHSDKQALSDIIKTAVNSQLDLDSFPDSGRKVIKAVAQIGTNDYGTFVIVVDKIDNDRVKLTNKNRIQFVTSYTANEANNGKRILAFTGMRYNDSSCIKDGNKGWFVSTSFADHKLNY